MAIVHIETKEAFEQEVLQSAVPVLVDFFATWCGPCKMIAPVLEEIAEEREDFKVVKIDVDQAPDLAKEYKIMSIPTLIVFKDGKAGTPALGARPKESILELVDHA